MKAASSRISMTAISPRYKLIVRGDWVMLPKHPKQPSIVTKMPMTNMNATKLIRVPCSMSFNGSVLDLEIQNTPEYEGEKPFMEYNFNTPLQYIETIIPTQVDGGAA